MATFKDFRNNVKPNWCPGCGDFSVQAAIQKATANIGLEPEDVAIITGIGCSGRLSGYINSYGVHSIHGRALPLAQGVKMANKDLTVIASGGDGDGYAIGMGHTIHALRRNMNMTYIVMDNQIYGLTKGQTSPSSAKGFVTKSTPKGNIEKNVVTYNKINTYDWFKEHLTSIDDIEGYDITDKQLAMKTVLDHESLVKGIVYQDTTTPSYESQISELEHEALAKRDIHITEETFNDLTAQFL